MLSEAESNNFLGIELTPPLDEAFIFPTGEDLDKTISDMILSPSGWRGVFASDGDEESKSEKISPAHKAIVIAGAKVFADYINCTKDNKNPSVVVVGMDTRPTGMAIAEAMIRCFAVCDCEVRFAFITSAPEIMAYSRKLGEEGLNAGFVYISASHNPIGHNGLKFGLSDGGVLSAEAARRLIADFHAFMALPDRLEKISGFLNSSNSEVADIADVIARIYQDAKRVKSEAYKSYFAFTQEVVSGVCKSSEEGTSEIFKAIIEGLAQAPLGLAIDFNGSARTLSIDREFFSSIGINTYTINDKAGEIAHRIVPEGESLDPCCRFLEEIRKHHPEVLLGYVPDCDGDRGNLVIWDEKEQKARSLEAQEVFALACVGELAHLVWTGDLNYNINNKAAVAVNDPTSMRIERIAAAFGATVFHAEVGEANVVTLARLLREEGYMVRILGEGSAGGNITHPSAVRDPINTVMAIVKLLTIRGKKEKKGFFELWCDKTNQAYRDDFSLSDIIASLPQFFTTGAYTESAILKVKTKDHGELKKRYQVIFLKEWEERKEELEKRYGIRGWSANSYNGTEERRGITCFGSAGKGGLKVIFTDKSGRETAWIWMRGSATEPVFRIMADAEGDFTFERYLIEWQKCMIMEADSAEAVNT